MSVVLREDQRSSVHLCEEVTVPYTTEIREVKRFINPGVLQLYVINPPFVHSKGDIELLGDNLPRLIVDP